MNGPWDRLETLSPVGLGELVTEAELLQRVDRKYLVENPVAEAMLDALDPRTRVLQIDGRREFAYDSVYFDTPDHLSYRLAALRRRHRFKVRTRSYLDTGTSFLELKTRSGRGRTVKNRIPTDPGNRETITPGGRAYLAGLLGHLGHDPALVDELRPTLEIRYCRTTLLLPGGSRATIDRQLRWEATGGGCGTSLPDHIIIETKSTGRPGQLDRALWRAGSRPVSLSKFGTGTAALHSNLPSNKWARVLRGPFAQQSVTAGTQKLGETR